MASDNSQNGQPRDAINTASNAGAAGTVSSAIPQVATSVEQNVRPVVNEAQRIAAETSVSGRHAVSRGTVILVFYGWLLRRSHLKIYRSPNRLFPGDKTIAHTLQKQHNP